MFPKSLETPLILKEKLLVPSELGVSGTVSSNVCNPSIARSSFTTTIHLSQKVSYEPHLRHFRNLINGADAANAVNARRVEDLKDFVSQCDIVAVNAPLHDGTRGLINADLLKHFKKVIIVIWTLCWVAADRSIYRAHGS